MIARAGSGHIGTQLQQPRHRSLAAPAGARDGRRPSYFSSKGHDVPGLYAVLIGLGRLAVRPAPPAAPARRSARPSRRRRRRHRDEHRLARHGDLQGQGHGARATGCAGGTGRVFVLTGDGELQEGQFWESLATAANRGLGEITVIVDHNKIQSDTWVARSAISGDLEPSSARSAGTSARCDGHDLDALAARARASCAGVTRPAEVLIADTIKGAGVSFMEHTAMAAATTRSTGSTAARPSDATTTRGAGGADRPAPNDGCRALGAGAARGSKRRAPRAAVPSRARSGWSPPTREALVDQARARAAARRARRRPGARLRAHPVRASVSRSASSSAGSPSRTWSRRPAGWRCAGCCRWCTRSPASSPTRPNEQIYNNATEQRKSSTSARSPGCCPADRATRTNRCATSPPWARIPGLVLLEPSCEDEVAQAVAYCLDGTRSSCYLRLVSIPCQMPYRSAGGYRLEPGRGVAITEGADAVLFGYGPVMLRQAFARRRCCGSAAGSACGLSTCPGSTGRLGLAARRSTARGPCSRSTITT